MNTTLAPEAAAPSGLEFSVPHAPQQALSVAQPAWWLLGPFMLAVACLAGAAIPLVPISWVLLCVAASALVGAVALYPPLAGYALIGVTPLIAGIDRGLLIPVFRPNEGLALLLALGLLARGLFTFRTSRLQAAALSRVDLSILLMAVASSVLPVAWLLVRGRSLGGDDILYTLQIWKFYGVYLIVRWSIRTERQVRACLWVSMIAGAVVAVIAILQALQLAGVQESLAHYYAPYGNVDALANNRGGSTLALPIAVADLSTFNLAMVLGFFWRERLHRAALAALGVVFVAGIIASGQFSGTIGLVVAAGTFALLIRRIGPVLALVPATLAAGVALRPVINTRLSGFQSLSGTPESWQGRLRNLRTIFWPELFSRFNFVLGVRPSARVASTTMATGFIWIESGYTWLLWSGGIPFLLAYLYFTWANLRSSITVARERADAVGVAATALSVALVTVAILMVLDPHLTYRGSADLLFALLALAGVAAGGRPSAA